MKLLHLLPFMDDEDLKELVQKIKTKEVTGVKLVHLYPFLNRESIDELVEATIKGDNPKDLYSALPFMSRSKLNDIYSRIQSGEITGIKEEALLPFLSRDKIKELVDKVIKDNLKNIDKTINDSLEGLDEKIEKAVEKAFDE